MVFSFHRSPQREYAVLAGVGVALLLHFAWSPIDRILLIVAAVGSLSLAVRAFRDVLRLHVTIDVFNVFALGVSFATGEVPSAAFIVLMITSADLLDWRTRSGVRDAVRELLALKPQTALRIRGEDSETIPATEIRVGDEVLVQPGAAIPVDGIVVSGRALVNEALVTGESTPVEKIAGSRVLVSTVADVGAIRVRATHIGKDSTIERMAELMRTAAANKSTPERLADRFAAAFLPLIILAGAGLYVATHDLRMVAAFFLVACADDMALAIPLAMTASLGWAARRGVIIKGGTWLHTLSRVQTVILDKTGTLTYGSFRLDRIHREPGVSEDEVWRLIGVAEKFSEHPIGRALFAQARQRVGALGDPDDFVSHKGAGVAAVIGGHRVAVGSDQLMDLVEVADRAHVAAVLAESRSASVGTPVAVLRDGVLLAVVSLADAPRPEAAESLAQIRRLGVPDILMFTGDAEEAAQRVAQQLGITRVVARMRPEDKLQQLERITHGPVAMVGDGINDAPALARADVGIAMGKGGTAIASEAADVVILTDDLHRLADIIRLGRRTMSVVRWDIGIWTLSNAVGFWLVLTGVAGPALAAFYNFATDFLPLINSSRLFRERA
ncbi:MAG: cation-translocating P-type ATPase [Candidatus Yanofskybacteria bacterium]|nr:cation-translocating P-type ATPase [Candidatus Yanofskybacteria bacterium]